MSLKQNKRKNGHFQINKNTEYSTSFVQTSKLVSISSFGFGGGGELSRTHFNIYISTLVYTTKSGEAFFVSVPTLTKDDSEKGLTYFAFNKNIYLVTKKIKIITIDHIPISIHYSIKRIKFIN